MSKMPWFRAYTEMIDDEKLRLLAFEDRWHFMAILCLKGQGVLDAADPLMMRKAAVKMEVSVEQLAEILQRLSEVGLVDPITAQPSMRFVATRETMRPPLSAWRVIRDRIFKRDDFTCRYCGAKGVRLECDHVVPVAKGGGHSDSNLATACRPCNRSKRDKLISEWRPA